MELSCGRTQTSSTNKGPAFPKAMELDKAFENFAICNEGFIVGSEDQPASIILQEDDNRVMRIPAQNLHYNHTKELAKFLGKVEASPADFQNLIEESREEKKSCAEEEKWPGKKYEIRSVLGKGSFSTVYVATRKMDGERFALKRVDWFGMKKSSKCFKEIIALESLKHDHIIECVDHFRTTRGFFIVLEWAGAGDLKRMLKRVKERHSRFHEKVVWNYFIQIARAVSFMHENRMIHRDIKPANIFIMPDGRLKLGDLGLSRALSEETVRAYSRVGTPLYMAPEVLQGNGHDFKSDLWSLGCVLYELALLHSPFEVGCKTMKGLFNRILRAEYFPIPANFSNGYHDFVHKLLDPDPRQRPDAKALNEKAHVLQETAADESEELQPVSAQTPIDDFSVTDKFQIHAHSTF